MNKNPDFNKSNNKGTTVKSNRFQSRNIKLLEDKEKRNRRILFGGVGIVLLTLSVLWIFSQAKTPYQIWSGLGNSGSESVYINSLKGKAGNIGDTGDKGLSGDTGNTAYEVWKKSNPSNTNKSESDYLLEIKGNTGKVGDSAYEVWKRSNLQNSKKSETEYIKSLKGDKGDNGYSSYEVWKYSGLENQDKTEDDYIAFLKGNIGQTGDTPYDIWKSLNADIDENTEYDYYKYIKGEKGDDGLSDYEIWKLLSPENKNKTKEEYKETLKGDRGDPGGEAGFTPGEVRIFVDNIDKEEWLLCDGSTYSMQQYPDLFRAIKKTTLPDYRGRVIEGVDESKSQSFGITSGSLTTNIEEVHLPKIDIELDFSHQHSIIAYTTENGAHFHKMEQFWSGSTGGGAASLTFGPPKNSVTSISTSQSGNHTHEVEITLCESKSKYTSFNLNTGKQSTIDKRQATTYYAMYIYAGKKVK